MHARSLPSLGSTLVACVLATGALTSCAGPDEEVVAVGEVEEYSRGVAEGTEVSVAVPLGRVEATVGEPVTTLGDLEAPEGGSLVRVANRFRDGQVRDDVWELAARPGEARSVQLSLAAGDEDYLLGVVRVGDGSDAAASVRAPQDLVVAVDGTPEELGDDLALEVTYDEVTQSVSVPDGERAPGPADALYQEAPDPATLSTTDCDPRVEPASASLRGLRCEVGAVRSLPYVPGLGWAEEGRTWLVVGAGVEVVSAELSGSTYGVGETGLEVVLDGQPPAAVLDPTGADGRASGQHVFDVAADQPSGEVGLTATLELERTGGAGGPAAAEAVLEADAAVALPGS